MEKFTDDQKKRMAYELMRASNSLKLVMLATASRQRTLLHNEAAAIQERIDELRQSIRED